MIKPLLTMMAAGAVSFAAATPDAQACEPVDARPVFGGLFPDDERPVAPNVTLLVGIEGEGLPWAGFVECGGVCQEVEMPALNVVERLPRAGLGQSLLVYRVDRELADGEYIVQAGSWEPYIETARLDVRASEVPEPLKADFSVDWDVSRFDQTNGGSCLGTVEGALQLIIRPAVGSEVAWYDVQLTTADAEQLHRFAVVPGLEDDDAEGIVHRVHVARELPECLVIFPRDYYGNAGAPVTSCQPRLCGPAIEPSDDPGQFEGFAACGASETEPPRVEPPTIEAEGEPGPELEEDEALPTDEDFEFENSDDHGCGCASVRDSGTVPITAFALLLFAERARRRIRARKAGRR